MKNALWILPCSALILSSCGDDDAPPPAPPTQLTVTVVDSVDDTPIAAAEVLLSSDGVWRRTDENGAVTVDVRPVANQYRAQAPGYLSEPLPLRAQGEVTAILEQTLSVTVFMNKREIATGAGNLRGRVTCGGEPVPGALVVAESTAGLSAYTDNEGYFAFLGIPASMFAVQAFKKGHVSSVANSVSVPATGDSEELAISLCTELGATIGGSVEGSGSVEVLLAHAGVGEIIPGLTASAMSGSWSVAGVAPGEYLVQASLAKDGLVADPQFEFEGGNRIQVTDTASITVPIRLVDAIRDIRPTGSSTVTGVPTFHWTSVPNADFYVVEVKNAGGRNIWGGFDVSGRPRFQILPPATSTEYTGIDLETGAHYFWRVFAAKRDPILPASFELISASEVREGGFRMRP